MMGWSGSPSRKSTITSWPMRGICTNPKLLPAQGCDTRTQHELLLVLLAVAVPVELDLHAAVLVGEDLLARRAHHHRGLRPLHEGLGRAAQRAELLVGAHGREAAGQLARPAARLAGLLARRQLQLQAQVFGVLVVARVLDQVEQAAGGQRVRVAHAGQAFVAALLLFQAIVGQHLAVVLLRVVALEVEQFLVGIACTRAAAPVARRAGSTAVRSRSWSAPSCPASRRANSASA